MWIGERFGGRVESAVCSVNILSTRDYNYSTQKISPIQAIIPYYMGHLYVLYIKYKMRKW